MNNERRKRIREAIHDLSIVSSKLESIKDDEDDARAEIPENLESGEIYIESEKSSDIIGDAISELNEITKSLEEIT